MRNELSDRPLTVLHIDFSAVVELKDGTKQHIIIELQKAKYYLDIERFRRYLATQYANSENCYTENDRKVAMPIFTIYFLGHYLDHTKVPVINVDRTYRDKATGREITEKEKFIEGLTHDSIVIQVPALKKHRRNKLEKVLSVFQTRSDLDNNHFIDIEEEDYPKEFKSILKRLLQAGASKKIRDNMILEDEVVEVLDNFERRHANDKELLVQKDNALLEKDNAIAKERKLVTEKNETIAEKDQVIAELKKKLNNK